MTRPWQALAAAVALVASGCSLHLDTDEGGQAARNSCTSSSECGDGECFSGACVAHEGALSSVLLEIAPPKSATGVGGGRFLQILDGLSRSSEGTAIDLRPTTVVTGFARAPDKACAQDGSLSVEVTFTPREEAYGLPVISYVARTQHVTVTSVNTCAKQLDGIAAAEQFVVSVPNGAYDVYVKPVIPDGAAASTACGVIPQLFRKITFADASTACLLLPTTTPQMLDVVVPWPADTTGDESLDGWALEVVHPLTGHVLSERVILGATDRAKTSAGPGYEHQIHFTPVSGDEPGKEIVRLTPPSTIIAPVIQADRSGLQAASASQQAVFPAIGPFPAPVSLDGWAYSGGTSSDDPQIAAPGRLSLTATELKGIKTGIFASYSTSMVVLADGTFHRDVLPGTYRARMVPNTELGLAAVENTLLVACDPDPAVADSCLPRSAGKPTKAQGGKTISVPQAATLSGTVLDAITGRRVSRVTIDAVPASVDTRECTDAADTACTSAPLGVLDISLGEDAFVPRAVTGVADTGTFTLPGLDCGQCIEGGGALFNVLAHPPDGSRLAWAVQPSVTVFSDVDLGSVYLPLPIVHRGKVEIPQQTMGAITVPNALVRAYVLRDDQGNVIDNPSSVQTCAAAASNSARESSARCIRSALQVAETRTDKDGLFEVILPSSVP
jgi:hypothetical protein